MKTHREQGKLWKLPDNVSFEGTRDPKTHREQAGPYKILGFRKPKAGEHYLSGTKKYIKAYRAPNDFSTEYLVVEPITKDR